MITESSPSPGSSPSPPTPVDPLTGCGGRILLAGMLVRMHLRYEPALQTIAGIAYTPHCSLRCTNMEHPSALLAWARGTAAAVFDPPQGGATELLELVKALQDDASRYARIIRENLQE